MGERRESAIEKWARVSVLSEVMGEGRGRASWRRVGMLTSISQGKGSTQITRGQEGRLQNQAAGAERGQGRGVR